MPDESPEPDDLSGAVEAARAGPARVRELCAGLSDADFRWKPGVGKLSLVEHLVHMVEMERSVFGVRLRRILAEDDPRLEPLDESHFIEEELLLRHAPADLLDAWEDCRRGNVDLVTSAAPEQWERPVQHPDLGKTTFRGVVGRWTRHDLDHVRQIEIIALNMQERMQP